MTGSRCNIFVVHSWHDGDLYDRMLDLLRAREAGLADYSVPAHRPLEGTDTEIEASIVQRMRTATAVVVLNSPGLGNSAWCDFELCAAVEMSKRVVVLQPHATPDAPAPRRLRESDPAVVPWRSDSLGRAIRGEWAPRPRVHDLAERADRAAIVKAVSSAAASLSILVLYRDARELDALRADFASLGYQLVWTAGARREVARSAGLGALIGAALGALLGSGGRHTLVGAAAGGLAGLARGHSRVVEATLSGRDGEVSLTLRHRYLPRA
ncbi:MAG: TIR domain-containing protein [Deltaproteobacteria bacterium]|nr:TIR domain-containing protein [Deltaproteobacteria bacterium]MCB9789285.1 TIR domain-containing protein [Deltaproteobacteria bacterium]